MRLIFLLLIIYSFPDFVFAQQGVGIGVTSPDPSAALHVQPPADNKGLLIPRLTTTQRNNIAGPAEGLLVYDISVDELFHYNAGWKPVGVPSGTIVMWSGTTEPVGWKLCDGVDGRPNLKGRFIVGYEQGSTDYGSIAGSGGSNHITLSTNNLPGHTHSGPSHNHTFDVVSGVAGLHFHGMTLHDNNGSDGYRVRSGGASNPRTTHRGWTLSQQTAGSNYRTTINDENTFAGHDDGPDGITNADIRPTGDHSHRVSGTTSDSGTGVTGSTGSGTSFDNRPRYYVLAFIIKL